MERRLAEPILIAVGGFIKLARRGIFAPLQRDFHTRQNNGLLHYPSNFVLRIFCAL